MSRKETAAMPDATTAPPSLPSGPDGGPGGRPRGGEAPDRVIIEELERRLAILEAADEDAFGRFGTLDWVVCIGGFVVLPLLLVWWAA